MSQPVPTMGSLFKLEYPQTVGIYNTYDEAQHVVDFLADARFPVENLCIVGTELKSVERVLGRRSWGTVITSGVQSGLSTGLMITLILWLFMPEANFFLLALYALGIGILVGVAMAALMYWMSQGKRDFTSVSQTIATKYELLAEHKVAGQARELIAAMPGAKAAQFDPNRAAVPQPAGYPPAQGYGTPYPNPVPQQPYGQPGYLPGPPAPYGQAPGYGSDPSQAYAPPASQPGADAALPPQAEAPATDAQPDSKPEGTAQ